MATIRLLLDNWPLYFVAPKYMRNWLPHQDNNMIIIREVSRLN